MIKKLRTELDNKKISVQELLDEYTKKISLSDLNAFITVSDKLSNDAKKAQSQIDKGQIKPLTGIPIAIKDNILTKGIKTTCASKMLENFVPDYNATVIDKIYDIGGIVLGKTNMDEFAMGNTSENSYFGAVKNPVDKKRVAGGSSGGSAAAVKAGLAPVALGSDTGGSVRQPSAFCGTLGLKPTYGRVSRFGLVAFASSLEQIGIIANTADDIQIVLDTVSGVDFRDSTTKNHMADFKNTKKIGIPKEFFEFSCDEVSACVLKTAKLYEKYGFTLEECSIPSLKYALSAYYIISSAEASSNLSRFDGIKYGFSAEGETFYDIVKNSRNTGFSQEVKRRIEIGNYVLSHGFYDKYYLKARAAANKIRQDMNLLLEKYDFLITPTVPNPAPFSGIKQPPVKTYREDILTVPANLTGLPALNIPCGEFFGMSITGKAFCEEYMLHFAKLLEKEGIF